MASSDWSAACALLAPATRDDLEQSAGTPCAEALAGEELSEAGPVARVQVFGTMAQARLGQDTFFLTRSRSAWTVLAAGCSRSRPARTTAAREAEMRVMFWVYLVGVWVGLFCLLALGLRHG